MKTKVITNEDFNGKKQFKIYEVDENGEKAVEFDRKSGEKKDKKPIVNFGITKAKAIFKCVPELQTFIHECGE